ncbi:hypothetical protein D3C83_114800 [compost metagenome]
MTKFVVTPAPISSTATMGKMCLGATVATTPLRAVGALTHSTEELAKMYWSADEVRTG